VGSSPSQSFQLEYFARLVDNLKFSSYIYFFLVIGSEDSMLLRIQEQLLNASKGVW
jgi:hypothetical protein